MNNRYPSSAASLFAAAARSTGDDVVVTCPYCFSEDTVPIENEYGLYKCNTCDTNFERADPQGGESPDG
jgi:transposase-like protein